MEQNRVLTLEEAISLPDGTTVWIEDRTTFESGEHVSRRIALDRPSLYECEMVSLSNGLYWGVGPKSPYNENYGDKYRAWLREPAPAELTANPWPQ